MFSHSFYFCVACADKSGDFSPFQKMTYLFFNLIMHYYAFVVVSLTWLVYFLSHDYFSDINSLVFFKFYVSLWRGANARNVRVYNPYQQYTNLFIFPFVFQHCLHSTLHFMFLSDEGPTFKTLDFTFYIGSKPNFLYFDLYFNTACAGHYILSFSLTKGLRSKR